jgi:hypothetical protein
MHASETPRRGSQQRRHSNSTHGTRMQQHQAQSQPTVVTPATQAGDTLRNVDMPVACKTRIDKQNGTSRHSAVPPHTGSPLARTPPSLSPLRKSTTTHANNRTQRDKHVAAARRTTIQLLPVTSRPNKPDTRCHTQLARHTHVRVARLPSVDGMLPESEPDKYKCLQDT